MSPEYAEFVKDLAERGILQGGERLRPTADATTVRVRDGEVLSTDGPFAETQGAAGRLFHWSTARTWTRPLRWRRSSPAPSSAPSK